MAEQRADPYPGDDEQAVPPHGSGGGPRPGARAEDPTGIPAQGWKQVLLRTRDAVKRDNVPLLAAGVAFWGFLSLFPALIAAVTVYGLVADADQVERQVAQLSSALPSGAEQLVTEQLRSITSSTGSSLGWGLAVGVAAALFTASAGVQNLVKAVNVCYDVDESRGFVQLRLLALALTAGALVFVGATVALIAVLPAVLSSLGLSGWALVGAQVARWGGLLVFIAIALTVVYRTAPDRSAPRSSWLSLGTGVATALWLVGSAGFAVYVSTLGSYGQTYGALAGVAVLLLWLFLSALAVLVGAEVNAEAERQTRRDTTSSRDGDGGGDGSGNDDARPAGSGEGAHARPGTTTVVDSRR